MRKVHNLKPCPFCGSIKLLECGFGGARGAFISCADCDALGPNAHTPDKAREKWNTRPVKEVSNV